MPKIIAMINAEEMGRIIKSLPMEMEVTDLRISAGKVTLKTILSITPALDFSKTFNLFKTNPIMKIKTTERIL